MGCGCGRRRTGTPVKRNGRTVGYTEVVGYYAVLPNGTEIPKVTEGESPFMSDRQAWAEVRAAGGGTIRSVKRRRP
jgi:hypothetical protein